MEDFCRSVQKTDRWNNTPCGVKTPQPCSGTLQDTDCPSEQHFSRRGTIALTEGQLCQGCQGLLHGSGHPGSSHTRDALSIHLSSQGQGQGCGITTPLALSSCKHWFKFMCNNLPCLQVLLQYLSYTRAWAAWIFNYSDIKFS